MQEFETGLCTQFDFDCRDKVPLRSDTGECMEVVSQREDNSLALEGLLRFGEGSSTIPSVDCIVHWGSTTVQVVDSIAHTVSASVESVSGIALDICELDGTLAGEMDTVISVACSTTVWARVFRVARACLGGIVVGNEEVLLWKSVT